MKKFLLLLFLLSFTSLQSQDFRRVRFNFGLGSIASISPSVTTLDFAIENEFSTNFFCGEDFLLRAFYSRKVEYFIPENRIGRYYPYLTGVSLAFLLNQSSNGLEFQEGIGPLMVYDRMFFDSSSLVGGMIFTFNALLKMQDEWGIGATVNYGMTFGGDVPSYFSADLMIFYNL